MGVRHRIQKTSTCLSSDACQKKRLNTQTMHFNFKWHHRNLSNKTKSECDSAVYCSLHGTQCCHLVIFDFLIPKIPKNTKSFIWQPRWNMISPVIFAGGLTIFAGALPPWVPPWWRGRQQLLTDANCWCCAAVDSRQSVTWTQTARWHASGVLKATQGDVVNAVPRVTKATQPCLEALVDS